MKNRAIRIFAILFCMTVFSVGAIKVSANSSPSITMDSYVLVSGTTTTFRYSGANSNSWIGIYTKGVVPGNYDPRSISWLYTSGESGTTDFSNGEPTNLTDSPLAVGFYTCFLFADGGYSVIAQCDFEVIEIGTSEVLPPSAVEYDIENTDLGLSDGIILLTPPSESENISAFRLYWGDNNQQKLADYTAIATVAFNSENTDESGKVRYNMTKSTIIPSAASYLLAFSISSDGESEACTAKKLSADSVKQFGDAKTIFAAITDTHITENSSHKHNLHYDMALKDIKNIAPSAASIVISGDITDNGRQKEYENVKAIEAQNDSLPPIYYTVGNHDMRGSDNYDGQVARFNENLDMDAPYYDVVINGIPFIFLGSEESGNNDYHLAEIYDEQQSWLKEKLDFYTENSKTVFVFLHQPLKNTVSGSQVGMS